MKTFSTALVLAAATGILAAPSAKDGVAGASSRGGRPQLLGRNADTGEIISRNWAGAVQEGRGWQTVTAETVIPYISGGSSNAAAAGWVGIDGAQCQGVILQTGVQALADGRVEAWTEWFPNPPYYYGSDFPVRGGDRLRMSVNATSTNSGYTMLENLTTGGQVYTPYYGMNAHLCLADADWVIELGGGANYLANFGTWSFENAYASGSQGTYNPQGSVIWDLEENGYQVTDCSAGSWGVSCRHR